MSPIVQAVNNFRNETGYKRMRKAVQNAAPPLPRPQLVRHLPSRQQDPLLINAPPTTSTVQAKAPAPVPAPAPAPPQAPVPTPAPERSSSPTDSSAPTPPPDAADEGKESSPAPPAVVDHPSPKHTASHGEPPPPG